MIGQTIGSGAFRFEIEKELGSGAMGTVYKARFHKDEKVIPVALKVVSLGLLGNEGAMARFEREANILKQLKHPHIVRLFASGSYRKTPFIAMEFVDGEPLDRVLGRRGKIGWEEVVAYAKQLCEALQYAHEKGIIHRDLKPSNLMITQDREGQPILKLTDFGIAKDTDVTALTGMNSTIGTAAYMSPEQCKGDKNLSHKSDLYSLGIVFFELLSGRKPFTAETTVDMFMKHVHEEPPQIGKMVQDLPAKLQRLIMQLLEKNKDDRPMDAAWVARMLGEVEEDAFTRKSAGLDAASARRSDRARTADSPPITDEDREAARLLKGVAKKKKKKKVLPFVQRKSTKAAILVAALLALVAVVYFAAFRGPSAEKLADAIKQAKSPSEKAAAAEAYLRLYGDQQGEATDQAIREFRAAKVLEREKQLKKRFGMVKWRDDAEGDDPGLYKDAMAALQAEKDGRLIDVIGLWRMVKEKAIEKFPTEAKLPYTFDPDPLARARWVWIAEKRIKDAESVPGLFGQLETKIQENRKFEKPMPFDPTSPESLAIKAMRLEADRFKDFDKARKMWEAVIGLTENDPTQQGWFLLASDRLQKAPKGGNAPAEDRLKRIREQLDAIKKAHENLKSKTSEKTYADWIALRSLCREVIELYDDETDKEIVDAVLYAKKVLAEAEKQKG